MKVIKNTSSSTTKSKFGNFELVPDAGWKISQTFIDFESGLLIVSTNDEDKSHWVDIGYGTRTIPTKVYVIDHKTAQLLDHHQWSKYFSYAPTETISDDKKYRLVATRTHNKENGKDFIIEELYETATGDQISSSHSLAFSETKRETLLEQFYRQQEEKRRREAEEKAMPTLQEFYEKELSQLNQGDLILDYYDSDFIYELTYRDSHFDLKRIRTELKQDLDFESLKYEAFQQYESIEAFSDQYLNTKSWYLKHRPFKRKNSSAPISQLLKKFVVEFFNKLRETHDFTFDEYYNLNNWENYYYVANSVKPTEYKQYCSHCRKPVRYFPRYPKYICEECESKPITDKAGVLLSFSNVGVSGGLRITYIKDGKEIKEETDELEKLCFIDGKRYIAREARFGGVVIQAEK